jgi:hypothetical protein
MLNFRKSSFYMGLTIRKFGPFYTKILKNVPGNLSATSALDGITAEDALEVLSVTLFSGVLDYETGGKGSLVLDLSLLPKYYDDPRFIEAISYADKLFNFNEYGSAYASIMLSFDLIKRSLNAQS